MPNNSGSWWLSLAVACAPALCAATPAPARRSEIYRGGTAMTMPEGRGELHLSRFGRQATRIKPDGSRHVTPMARRGDVARLYVRARTYPVWHGVGHALEAIGTRFGRAGLVRAGTSLRSAVVRSRGLTQTDAAKNPENVVRNVYSLRGNRLQLVTSENWHVLGGAAHDPHKALTLHSPTGRQHVARNGQIQAYDGAAQPIGGPRPFKGFGH